MNRASVFCIGAGSFAGTGDAAIFMTDFRAFEFHSAFCNFNTITMHTTSRGTNRDAIFINRKVIFINRSI